LTASVFSDSLGVPLFSSPEEKTMMLYLFWYFLFSNVPMSGVKQQEERQQKQWYLSQSHPIGITAPPTGEESSLPEFEAPVIPP
jgi:hypothetical protein